MGKVVLEHITKRWGKVIGVKDFNVEIADGEFFTLLGPSGCGKSTALNLVAGLERPTEGNIYIGDKKVNDLPPKDRDIAMVFQSYAIYPHMSVRENIAFPLKLRKYSKEEINGRIDKAAKILRIEKLLGRKPKELSGGQRQRVALGRAIVRKPKVFLMDEPLSNLDAKLRLHMRVELKKLHEKLGVTTIYVTHDQAEAMTMADRIALLKDGLVQQISSPTQLYDHPTNTFVAGFLGSPSMNLIEGTLRSEANKLFFDASGFSMEIQTNKVKLKEKINQNLILGVRPEDLLISKAKKLDSIEAVVYAIEPMGNELLLTLEVGEDTLIARTKPTLEVKEEEKVSINIDKNRIHLFEKESEKSIF